jgi:hypothetical protein
VSEPGAPHESDTGAGLSTGLSASTGLGTAAGAGSGATTVPPTGAAAPGKKQQAPTA